MTEQSNQEADAQMQLLRIVADTLICQLSRAYTPYEVMVLGCLIQAMGTAHMNLPDEDAFKAMHAAHLSSIDVFRGIREQVGERTKRATQG